LKILRPPYWFAAHHHTLFAALVKHDGSPTIVSNNRSRPAPESVKINKDEIEIDLDDEDLEGSESSPVKAESIPSQPLDMVNPEEIKLDDLANDVELEAVAIPVKPTPATTPSTKFLALNKCLPGREFLQILEIDTPQPIRVSPNLTFDPIWLAITRSFHSIMPLSRTPANLPTESTVIQGTITRELNWVRNHLPHRGEIPIGDVQNFVKTAPAPEDPNGLSQIMPPAYSNPQTRAFCDLIGIDDKVSPPTSDSNHRSSV